MATTTAPRRATRPGAQRTSQRTGRSRATTGTVHESTGRSTATPAAPVTTGTNTTGKNGGGKDTTGKDTGGGEVSGTEQRVRTALAGGADLTVGALADGTGLGRSTVSKILTRLEAAGDAVRTTSGSAGRARQPDRWNPTAATAPPETTDHPAQPGTNPEPDPATQPEAIPGPEAKPQPERQPQANPDPGPEPKSPSQAEPQAEPQPHPDAHPDASSVPTDGPAEKATGEKATGEEAPGEGQPAAGRSRAGDRGSRGGRRSTKDTPSTTVTPAAAPPGGGRGGRRNPKTGTARLAPGALTQLVANHFSAHPGVPLTSGEVGRALGRSGGAVRNAADKLTGDGVLRLLDGTPRRYTTAE